MQELLKKQFGVILEDKLLAEVLEVGKGKNIKEGDVIMDYSQKILYMPFVLSGSIRIMREDSSGRELFLYYINGGDTCAMSMTCCLQGKKSEIKAVAEKDCLLWQVPVHFMDEWISKYSSWRAYVFDSFTQRFNELLETIDSIAFLKMDERLFKYLQDHKRTSGSYVIAKTHQEIANELNTSRVVISRLLKQLEKEDRIELYRNRIEIL